MDAISTAALTKYYGKARGITDIHLTVPEGDFRTCKRRKGTPCRVPFDTSCRTDEGRFSEVGISACADCDLEYCGGCDYGYRGPADRAGA